jgi:hypothetical protein
VGHLGHDVRRGEAPNLLELDTLQELGTGHAVIVGCDGDGLRRDVEQIGLWK